MSSTPRTCLLLLSLVLCGFADESIVLNEKEYFSAPGFSFLLFHNNYQVGYQGGLQMIRQDERLLDSGDLYLVPKGGQPVELRILRREVDRAQAAATVFGEIPGAGSGYRLLCRTDGRRILVTLRLDRPIDWSRYSAAGFKIALYPGAYFSKSFVAETGSGVFPRQFTGKRELLGGARTLTVAQEDPTRAFSISRARGSLSLIDPREGGPQPWFMIMAPFESGSGETEIEVAITPSLQPGWRRPPIIAVSQVGYLPSQPKQAVVELDSQDDGAGQVTLHRLELAGGKRAVKASAGKAWGSFLRYRYLIFDFSEVREPGAYVIEFRGTAAGPFRIAPDVYDQAWRPTLQYFLPAQMCHVAVREGSRTWHGACHLDDALQAPAGKRHLDGYQQGERETRFADNEHISGLDWGGWHDAGDQDLPAGSIAMTTLALALAHEEFRPSLDETSVSRSAREVLLHVPDGRQDLLQQIEYGVEGLLASFRVGGHIFPGIIETTSRAYTHVGDPVNITDNLIYDPKLKPEEARGGHSGKFDDRWVFTNRNTGLQYLTAQALAAAGRVLREADNRLATECLNAARKLYDDEQARPPVYTPNAYAPGDSGYRSEEISASVEMLLTTQEARYRERLLQLLPQIRSMTPEQFGEGPGWTLMRALPSVPDEAFRSAVMSLARGWKAALERRTASNPYGVPYPPEVSNPAWKLEARTGIHSGFVWGHGWDLQSAAMAHYYLHKHAPELFDARPLYAVVDFVHGCNPASNQSFVSGVGAFSPLIAYGYSRADWSHIPGGVISGTSLVKPDLMELKVFPFLWYQTEYVISGAATYIFDLLAAQHLLPK